MKKLYVFDFDGCLAETLDDIDGKILYVETFGKVYPHIGWWSKHESLSPEFNIQLYEPMVNIARNKMDSDIVYILTSRLPKFTDRIKEICEDNNLHIDEDFILTKTKADKGERLFDLATKHFGEISEIVFYDDRDKEILSAEEWKNKIEHLGIILTINKITQNEEL